MAHSHSHDGHSGHSHDSPAGHSHSHASPESIEVDDGASSPESTTESAHQATVVATFDLYLQQAISANQRRRRDFYGLSLEHQSLLEGYTDLLAAVDDKLQLNADLVREMVEADVFPMQPDAALSAPAPKESDHERLRSTLRQCARDWSEAGKEERDSCYEPILEALRTAFNDLPRTHRGNCKVLVPGAGLGRLAWEIVREGFSCQANEFSLFMLIASAYILNQTTSINQHEFYPYLHSFSNRRSKEDLLTPVYIPDVLPATIAESGGDFSFAAGDFLEVYRNDEGTWDSVVTCFFIDTARNIVDYLKLIHSVLKVGGVWINCGPTLWHFENSSDGSSSIELPLEDVKTLARKIGFVITEEKEIRTPYTTNPLSMLRHEYTASFWIARKVEA